MLSLLVTCPKTAQKILDMSIKADLDVEKITPILSLRSGNHRREAFMSHTYTICPSCQSINKLSPPQKSSQTPVCGKCQTPLALHERTSEVDSKGFEKLMNKSEKPLVIDFWASWCGPCQMYGPEFVKASAQVDQAVFVKVNTETQQTLAAKYGVRGIPCTVVVHQGKEIARQSGAMSAAQLQAWLETVLRKQV